MTLHITYVAHTDPQHDVIRHIHGRITFDKGGEYIYVQPLGCKVKERIRRTDIAMVAL